MTPTTSPDEDHFVALTFDAVVANALLSLSEPLNPNEVYTVYYDENGVRQRTVIERDLPTLSREDMQTYAKEVAEAQRLELERWINLKCFVRMPKTLAKNRIDSRWVMKYKVIDGKKEIKARLTVRGFKDMESDTLQTFAGTATRWGQRMVCSVAAQYGWELWSADVSMAFLRGLTFKEIAKLSDTPVRAIQFDLPPGANFILRQFNGFQDFDHIQETLDMTKPGIGTKDVPWAWGLELSATLHEYGWRPTKADARFFVLHSWLVPKQLLAHLDVPPPATEADSQLLAVCSTHVDDLKGASIAKLREHFFAVLEGKYDKLKVQLRNFECVGVRHTQSADYTVTMDQDEYAKQLRAIDTTPIKFLKDDEKVPQHIIGLLQSLLGALSWMVLTRVDIVVFVNRLQRNQKEPSLKDVKDVNKLMRWVQRQSSVTTYARMAPPLCITVLSDAAYRADDEDCLALRAAVAVLIEERDGVPGGKMHLLDFYSRKQTRVNRSTFSAELNALLEATDLGLVLCCFAGEVVHGTTSARELARSVEIGNLPFPLHLVGDAHAVFSAIVASEISVPNERTMLFGVKAVRDYLDTKKITALHRVDTRDMLADGLTKGTISRDCLLLALKDGEWRVKHTEQLHSFSSGEKPHKDGANTAK